MNFKVKSIILLFAVCFQISSSSINEKICGDIEIQNETLSDLDKFIDCTILNSLLLWKIESLNPFLQINNISFSHLREISGSLEIYEVGELISLKHLFPKLAVIRGRRTYHDGLTLSFNKDLENIGLNNLKHIGGSIDIQDNPKLCFVDTINWKELMSNPDDTLSIVCCKMHNNDNCQSCSHSKFCWNEEDSQVICDSSCLSGVCERNGTCCSSECLGGCSSDPNECEVCRNLSYNGTCVRECPEKTFVFKDRNCVTSEECENENLKVKKNEIRMQVYDGKCTNSCPIGTTILKYMLLDIVPNLICIEDGKEVCNRNIIITNTSYYYLSKVRNCAIITGFLEIDLSFDVCEDEDFVNTLWEIFSRLEEIYKYLKISGTKIKHLGFLSKLQRIRGIELESEKYSLILENNENLRNLWLQGQNVSLDRGETKLVRSQKLCSRKDFDDFPIKFEIKPKTYAAEIKWNSTEKRSNNLMYEIWEAHKSYRNIGSFCPTKNAKLIKEETPGVQKLYGLAADTEYAYQMFDGNLQNPIGAQKYFHTLHVYSNEIIDEMIVSTTSSSIAFYWNNSFTFHWDEPSTLDDFVRLEIKAFRIPPDDEFYRERNYCNSTTNNSSEYHILDRNEEVDIALIDRMRSDIKELFKRELLNEEISKNSIGREFFFKVKGATNRLTFDDVDHFSRYFVSIRSCYQYKELDCTAMKIFSIQTTANDEADQIENLTGKVVNSNAIKLKWDSPSRPNGLVLTFFVYVGIVGSNQKSSLCSTYQEFIEGGNAKLIENLTPGKYEFTVVVRSLAGNGRPSDPIFVEIEPSYLMYWIISSLSLILIVLVILLIFQVKQFKKHRRVQRSYFKATFISKPEDDSELERENIKILDELGKGNFGLVFEGILKSEEENGLRVAVKTVNNEASLEDSINFLKEATIMKNFKTFHVIKLLGIVCKSKPYYVVMELMTNGDLKTFLRKNRPLSTQSDNYSQFPLSSNVPPVSHMAIQIADGMAYLAHKKFVHRDLAARNCMVSADLTVKIGDFGLTRDIYEADYYRQQTNSLMPVRWMSPESLKDGIFSSESDVFSYGIVLWEITTYAEQPYKGKSNNEVLNFIIKGGTESRPDENCSVQIYEIMTKCWRFLPENRISFIEIIEELLTTAPSNISEQSFYCLRD